MRAFVLLCVIAVAAAQYEYGPGQAVIHEDDATSGHAHPAQPINEFTKEFYTYTAPEAEFVDDNANQQIANSLKRALRVVFIKGPENSALENAALNLAQSASDDRTAIYVLNKQADIGDLANKLNQFKSHNANKPEVHFVKYRTQADAENAQRTIQAQYDTLPGPSSNNNGGAAQVLDFASKSTSTGTGSETGSNLNKGYIPPTSAYLPPGRGF